MTYFDFRNKYLGKKVDYDGSYGAQCWDLAQQYVTECLKLPATILGGVGIVNNLLKEPKLSLMKQYFDIIPLNQKEQGDIEVFNWGHIAIMDRWDKKQKLNYYLSQNSGTAENPYGVTEIIGIRDNEKCMAFRVKKQTVEEEKIYYVVKAGDTLSAIGKMYNMDWTKIYNDNKNIIGENPNLIKPGQKLVIKK